jgi:hypothetical protein
MPLLTISFGFFPLLTDRLTETPLKKIKMGAAVEKRTRKIMGQDSKGYRYGQELAKIMMIIARPLIVSIEWFLNEIKSI